MLRSLVVQTPDPRLLDSGHRCLLFTFDLLYCRHFPSVVSVFGCTRVRARRGNHLASLFSLLIGIALAASFVVVVVVAVLVVFCCRLCVNLSCH